MVWCRQLTLTTTTTNTCTYTNKRDVGIKVYTTEITAAQIQATDTWYKLWKTLFKNDNKKVMLRWSHHSLLMSWVSLRCFFFTSSSLPNRFTANYTQAGHRWDNKNTTFWFCVAIYVRFTSSPSLRYVTHLNTCLPMRA